MNRASTIPTKTAKRLTDPVRRALEHWVRARSPRVAGPVMLARRRIFILPSRFGYGYGGLLLLMLIGAINYGNSMAFILTFLLGGIGFVVMHHTHANLANLKISLRPPQAVFAGQLVVLELELSNGSRRARYVIKAGWPRGHISNGVDIPPGGVERVTLQLASSRRGWLAIPRFEVQTEFPLGLFHAWARVEIDRRALIYPHPAGKKRPSATTSSQGGRHLQRQPANDEFVGLRDYRPGDSLRIIHWKSLARLAVPVVKQFHAPVDDELWLDWEALPQLDTEARLSQLTRWLLDAEAEHRAYGLRLPGSVRAPALDIAHRNGCLRALALFGVDSP